jgi:hypothetical protein
VLGSIITNDASCTGEIKSRIAMANKQAGYFHKKFDFHLWKKLKKRYIFSIDLRGAAIWTL